MSASGTFSPLERLLFVSVRREKQQVENWDYPVDDLLFNAMGRARINNSHVRVDKVLAALKRWT